MGTSPNIDGIHIEKSTFVSVLNSTISTGDDDISMSPGARNVWIERVACGPGHGISIGSLGWKLQEPSIQNVTVKRVHFVETTNGLRIKTWARPSLGFVTNVLFQHVLFDSVKNSILIDQNYCPGGRHCPRQGHQLTYVGGARDDKEATATYSSPFLPFLLLPTSSIKPKRNRTWSPLRFPPWSSGLGIGKRLREERKKRKEHGGESGSIGESRIQIGDGEDWTTSVMTTTIMAG
ncbi:unnamed protein product [Linum tenue]|uniref:Polygalacturonase n=1 Tax=Linum tenue TaxID=586396 RepID=A0AAV0NPK3_9ROSI|nr:unnamed protein product [Linum tenue]